MWLNFLKPFLCSLALILLMDFIWLGFVMKNFNLRQLANIARIENGNFQLMMLPALGAYLLMACSLTFFAYPKATSASASILWGAFLGLIIFGVFDLTNLAILKNYPIPFAMADIAWGTFLYGFATWLIGWHFAIGRGL